MIFLKQTRLMKRSSWGRFVAPVRELFVCGLLLFFPWPASYLPHTYAHTHTRTHCQDLNSFWVIKWSVLVYWAWFLASTLGTTPKSTLKLSSKEEHLPCLRLVVEVATDPTPEQEFYGSSIFMEQSHAHNMTSLLTKAKATKQAKIQKAAQNSAATPCAHKRHAQQHEPMEIGWSSKQTQEPVKLNNMSQWRLGEAPSKNKSHWSSTIWANEAQKYVIEARQFEPMKLGWSPKQ